MAFKDLRGWVELGGLRLPINGKTYILPAVDAELGPRLQALVAAGVDVAQGKEVGDNEDVQLLNDRGENQLYRDVLGPVYDEMIADKVPWAALKLAAMTAILDAGVDRATAEQYWANRGKPPRKRPADRKPKDPKVTEIATKRASTAGTTSHSKPSTAKAPPGETSSSSGS